LSETVPPTREYLRVLWRRKWVVFLTVVVVVSTQLFFSLQQKPLYGASAEVLLNRQNLAASLTGIPDLSIYQQPDRVAQTQADLARAPIVVERTLRSAHFTARELSTGEFLRHSTVSTRANSDLLDFDVTDSNPSTATRLATEYARQFTNYERELDTNAIENALKDVQQRIDTLTASGDRGALYVELKSKAQQLRAIQALQTTNSLLVSPAKGATQVAPRPVRSVILGLGVALVLGIGLAFLWEALDRRVASAEEIRERLGLPLLGRVPAPTRKPLREESNLPVLLEPNSVRGEAFRTLRAAVELADLEIRSRTIMVTSAVEGSEKSMTVANLGVAFARAGRRVVLVDLNLRNPRLDRFFGLEGRPGLADVALQGARLEEALAPIETNERDPNRATENRSGWGEGVLEVLPSGQILPSAAEIFDSRIFSDVLDQLSIRADLVLIDAPPLLAAGEAVTLSAKVEALLIVVSLEILRPTLTEVHRLLETCRARKLGFVLAGPSFRDGYESSFRSALELRNEEAEVRRRPRLVSAEGDGRQEDRIAGAPADASRYIRP
jgi:Mrp family chromosome partitioning ATPase/capsular polysaccharide biosynthesis protein